MQTQMSFPFCPAYLHLSLSPFPFAKSSDIIVTPRFKVILRNNDNREQTGNNSSKNK